MQKLVNVSEHCFSCLLAVTILFSLSQVARFALRQRAARVYNHILPIPYALPCSHAIASCYADPHNLTSGVCKPGAHTLLHRHRISSLLSENHTQSQTHTTALQLSVTLTFIRSHKKANRAPLKKLITTLIKDYTQCKKNITITRVHEDYLSGRRKVALSRN